MVVLIIFNITIQNVYAEPIAVTVGSLKLLQFLLACLAVGIGFNAVEEAQKLMEEYNSKYYNGGEPPNTKETIINLLGMHAVDSIFDIVDNLVDMFKDEQKEEGINYYNYIDAIKIDNEFEQQEWKLTGTKVIHYRGYNVFFKVNDNGVDICTSVDCYKGVTGWAINKNRDPNFIVYGVKIKNGRIYVNGRMFIALGDKYYADFDISLDKPEEYDEVPMGSVEYYLGRDSKILTGEQVTEDDIKYINVGYIPEDKLQREITADGVKTYYDGTMEELLNDIVNNTPWTKVVTDTPTRVFENEEGKIEIEYGYSPEPEPDPEPDPEPEPEPEPDPEPEPNPYEIPNDDININWDPLFNINIKDKFPFSLPWDIKKVVEMFIAEREAPVWELPLKDETIVIDFNNFEELARITRLFNTIIFVVILIILTRRFISGA